MAISPPATSWSAAPRSIATVLVPVGSLTVDNLAGHAAPPGENLYLRLVQKPFDGIELTRWQLRPDRVHFHAPSRLARVGLFARLVDAGFTISLLLRGTVPGGTAAAAQVKYAAAVAEDPRIVYHGRVVRRNGWIVLQYLFFYFMNDYRSTFGGANDHESDWEQVFVFLDDRPEGPQPVWIAAAAHDYTGDELRRRWDDPTITLHGEHPVLFAGGGSHASYFEQGDYLTQLPLPFARGARGALDAVRSFWRDTLNQPDPGDLARRIEGALSVPFIDYGRGDGRVVGPGGTRRLDPGAHRRQRPVGRWLPRAVRPGHLRPVRGRAGAGRPQVHPVRHGPPDVERSARVRRAGQDGAALTAAGAA